MIAANPSALLDGNEPAAEAAWNAVCLADFGDGGVAFVAQPQIPPRNVNWSSQGCWVHCTKIAFEKFFLRKVRRHMTEPIYERSHSTHGHAKTQGDGPTERSVATHVKRPDYY